MELGVGGGSPGDMLAQLGYTLKTSEDEKEILSFSETVDFGSEKEPSLILYINVTLSC